MTPEEENDNRDYSGIDYVAIDLSSTGKMKMPTYPLIEKFNKNFAERIKAMMFQQSLKQVVIEKKVYMPGMSSDEEDADEEEELEMAEAYEGSVKQ